jgi:hypothetical protein
MSDLDTRTRDAEIDDVIARMDAESTAFLAATTERAREWTRERINRYVLVNYTRTIGLSQEQLSDLRAAADKLADVDVPERIAGMVGRRDDIWMHRRPSPGKRGLLEYDGGDRLPYRIKNAIVAALGGADRLLDDYGYLVPGMSGGAGFDPTPRMRRTLSAYVALQPELSTLLAQDHAARRVQRQLSEADRDEAARDVGEAEAAKRWQAAGTPASGTAGASKGR